MQHIRIHSIFLLLGLILFASCKVEIKNELTDEHKYIIKTNCYIIPPTDRYKETREYSGLQGNGWSIEIKKESAELDYFDKLYSKANLIKIKRELIDRKKVMYDGTYPGILVRHKTMTPYRYSYALVIDYGEYRVHLKAWIDDYWQPQLEEPILKSIHSIYLTNPQEVSEAMDNPFSIKSDQLVFKGRDEKNNYLYEKKQDQGDGFKLRISPIVERFNYTNHINHFFEDYLGVDYEKQPHIVLDSAWLTKLVVQKARDKNNSKEVVAGYNAASIEIRYFFMTEYVAHFEENERLSVDLAKKIKFYP